MDDLLQYRCSAASCERKIAIFKVLPEALQVAWTSGTREPENLNGK
jgi:hypothetical protein